jgi:hypothetical protein
LKWLYHLTTARNFFKQCSHCRGSSGEQLLGCKAPQA